MSLDMKNILTHLHHPNSPKDYQEADKIRDYLLDKGVLIEDKDGKTSWKIK